MNESRDELYLVPEGMDPGHGRSWVEELEQ